MSLYQRGKSWYYDFLYRGQRYTGNIGPVSRTVAKEIMAKKKAEAVERRYELPSKRPSPLFDVMVEEYMSYYRANRRPGSVRRHEMACRALKPMNWLRVLQKGLTCCSMWRNLILRFESKFFT